jgi:ribonuclease BN (tRNA processing enzyme)
MRCIFLGTNGWFDTQTGNTIYTLIETQRCFIILDAGNGIHKIDRYVYHPQKPVFLFLSHFHLDHVIGLHTLSKFTSLRAIEIYGPPGARHWLNLLINYPFTVPLRDLPFDVTVHELDEGPHNLPFSAECRRLLHPSTCYGYRFTLEGKTVAYCPDTGVCENAVELAKNADLLVIECSLKSGEKNPKWPHLNPEDAIAIARDASAKKLALVHFDANIYASLLDRLEIESKFSQGYTELFVTTDDMVINL